MCIFNVNSQGEPPPKWPRTRPPCQATHVTAAGTTLHDYPLLTAAGAQAEDRWVTVLDCVEFQPNEAKRSPEGSGLLSSLFCKLAAVHVPLLTGTLTCSSTF